MKKKIQQNLAVDWDGTGLYCNIYCKITHSLRVKKKLYPNFEHKQIFDRAKKENNNKWSWSKKSKIADEKCAWETRYYFLYFYYAQLILFVTRRFIGDWQHRSHLLGSIRCSLAYLGHCKINRSKSFSISAQPHNFGSISFHTRKKTNDNLLYYKTPFLKHFWPQNRQ